MTKISENPVFFIFRRDLRTVDNTALNHALNSGFAVITAFICDPRQFEPHPYQSEFGLRFLKESLAELSEEISQLGGRLQILSGVAEEVIPALVRDLKCPSLYLNADYTPFSRTRDQALRECVEALGTNFYSFDDLLINPPSAVLKDDGKPYTIFTPYHKKALKLAAPINEKRSKGSFYSKPLPNTIEAKSLISYLAQRNSKTPPGGRQHGIKILKSLKRYSSYERERDIPSIPGTTQLSPHHKFGTISIRETLAQATSLFGRESTLVRELYWRDFFTQIAFHFPHVFKRSFNAAYDRVEWHDNKDHFTAWCQGNTGFPIVDAGMRELNQTGFMHNRVRMIVASFLTKDLHISWREGERYFAQKLVDYDPAVNNGSWQWAASTGCDAQPYFRIFNPWLQQKRFDPDCLYIKKWVPELKKLTAKQIHSLCDESLPFGSEYSETIVDHAREKRITEDLFKAVFGKE